MGRGEQTACAKALGGEEAGTFQKQGAERRLPPETRRGGGGGWACGQQPGSLGSRGCGIHFHTDACRHRALSLEFGSRSPLPTPGGPGQGTTRDNSPDSPDEEAPDLASGLTPSSWPTPRPPVAFTALALFPSPTSSPGPTAPGLHSVQGCVCGVVLPHLVCICLVRISALSARRVSPHPAPRPLLDMRSTLTE